MGLGEGTKGKSVPLLLNFAVDLKPLKKKFLKKKAYIF